MHFSSGNCSGRIARESREWARIIGAVRNICNLQQGVTRVLHPDESYQIMGACFEVHNRQGCGFLEAVYQECLGMELSERNIPYVAQPELQLNYRGQRLKQTYQPDFICYEKIIVEIKAVSELIEQHAAQVINYLHAGGFELGILVNFGGHPKLEYKRLALSKENARE